LEPGLVATSDKDGRIELFGLVAGGHELLHCWQRYANTANNWSAWASLGGSILAGFAACQDRPGRLEIFAVSRTNRAVMRICQTAPGNSTNWTAWKDF